MANYILAIDQGTTSSRAVIFDQNFRIIGASQQEFLQYYPKSGWVEHKPDDLLSSVLTTTRQALDRAGISARDILAAGITNQRETTIVWDRHTGDAIYNAIVWQDRRTADYCDQLKAENIEKWLSGKTGLLLDPYFAATKIKWLLDKIDGAMEKAKAGDLLFGTIDCWLIWKLTKRASHVTDATNASRSLMYNIHHHKWDEDLLKLFEIPESILPDVKNSADDFGIIHKDFFGSDIPLLGVAGDQQSALIGQACFQPGMLKSTYGTGCFAILNTGKKAVVSEHRLLTTIAYQLDGEVVYGLEGSIFIAGAAVQWLRDEMGLIKEASEAETLAEKADPEQHIYLVPAFSGLGAPYWDTNVRGAIFGLTRGTGACEFAKAALESVGYQTKDLLEVMHQDWQEQANNTILRVDGGMTASDWMMQFLSDILGVDVDCPENSETTILGAAYLAGLKAGFYPNPDQFSENWTLKKRFRPQMTTQERQNKYQGWLNAVTSLINPLG